MNANILWCFGPFSLTRFGMWIALGALVWVFSACAVRAWKYPKMPRGAVWCAGFAMTVCGLAGARLVYCAANFDIYLAPGAQMQILRAWEGGLSMGGALAGAFAGLCLAACCARVKPGRLANCFGPGLGLFAACVVLAQTAIGEGWGKLAEAGWVGPRILGVVDLYGDVRYAVWRLELLGCAAAVLAGLAPLCRRKCARFAAWNGALGAYSALRMVTASMREGAVLRVEYFRIEQIAGVAFLLVIALCRLAGAIRAGQGRRALGSMLVFLTGTVLAVCMEFAVDREGNMEWKYMAMLLGALMCLLGAWRAGKRRA